MGRCRYLKSVSVFRYFSVFLKVGSVFGIGIQNIAISVSVFGIFSRLHYFKSVRIPGMCIVYTCKNFTYLPCICEHKMPVDIVEANTEPTFDNFGILSSVFGIFRYCKYRRRYRY